MQSSIDKIWYFIGSVKGSLKAQDTIEFGSSVKFYTSLGSC